MRIRFFLITHLAVFFFILSPAIAKSWSFNEKSISWAPKISVEPGVNANRVLQIDAERPHHTRVTVPEDLPTSFMVETRVRLHNSSGAPPVAYVYGLTEEGFIALALGSGRARLFYWRGTEKPSISFGYAVIPSFTSSWIHVKLAMQSQTVAAKVWPEGLREPGWMISGCLPDVSAKKVALGVWLPPKKASRASMLFDDLTLRPVQKKDRVAVQAVAAKPLEVPQAKQTGIFETGPHTGIISDRLVVAFDRSNGSLRHLVDRRTGQSFASAVQRRPLFRILLTRWRKGDADEITSDEFARLTMKIVAADTLGMAFSEGPEPGMSITATITAGKDGLVHFGLAVKNPTDQAVASIQYPCFVSPAALGGDAGDDRLLFPQRLTDGIVVNAPGRLNRRLNGLYPGSAAVQMMALYDSLSGLMLATQDSQGHCKKFEVEMAANRFVEIKVNHLRPEVPGDGVIPYTTVMGVFSGDWHDAADLYKRWARQQPWCARKLTQREDIPAFLKEGSAGIIFNLSNPEGYNGSMGPDLERLPEITEVYRKRAGVPHMIVVPYGWENRGTWAGINYFPARPSDDAWRKANAALRAQGDRSALLTSGPWWVVRRPLTNFGPAFDDTHQFERQKAMVIHNADGTPWLVDNTHLAGHSAKWRGVSAKLCHGSAEARKVMFDIFLRTAEMGATLISFDQETGGGQSVPCYAVNHGHPPGYGAWMWSDFQELCKDIRAEGSKINPEIGLLVENCGEMIIQVMATYWSRQFGVLDHGSSGEGPIGLFSYLYHEYVTAIGAAMVQGQGPRNAKISPGLRCQALAHNVTRGLIPCPKASQVPLKAKDNWTKEVSAAYFAYCRIFASFPEYLILGETLHPPKVNCETREEWFIPKKKGAAKKDEKPDKHKTRPLPVVVSGRFKAPDGTRGSVIVNTTPQQQRADIIDPGRGRSAKLYRVDNSIEKTFDALPEKLTIELEPFGVRMLIVQ